MLTARTAPLTTEPEVVSRPPIVGEVEPDVETLPDGTPIYECPIPPLDPYNSPFPPTNATLTRGLLPLQAPMWQEGLNWMAMQTGQSLEDWTATVNLSLVDTTTLTGTTAGANVMPYWGVKDMGVSWCSSGATTVDIHCESCGTTSNAWGPEWIEGVGTSAASAYGANKTLTRYVRYVADNTAIHGYPSNWVYRGDVPYETSCTWQWYDGDMIRRSETRHTVRNRRDTLADIIRSRMAPAAHIRTGRRPIQPTEEARELRARETLRRVVGDDSYRNFLLNGFISVKSRRSGRVYVVYPGHGTTKVFKDGKFLERLCVVIPGAFPPTDSLITRYLMILNNEEHFRSLANKSDYNDVKASVAWQEPQSLVEIARNLSDHKHRTPTGAAVRIDPNTFMPIPAPDISPLLELAQEERERVNQQLTEEQGIILDQEATEAA